MSQAKKLYELLSDYQPHSTPEILKVVYGVDHSGNANIKGRVSDLRKAGYIITNRIDSKRRTVSWYQLQKPPRLGINDILPNKFYQGAMFPYNHE
jgi:hypothetical protein